MDLFKILRKKEPVAFEIKKEEVESEEKLVEKVSDYLKNSVPGQKMELTLSSVQNPHLVTRLFFGFKEKESFDSQELKAAIEVNDPSKEKVEEKPSGIRWNIRSSQSKKEEGSSWVSFSQSHKDLKGLIDWEESPREDKDPLCFFEIVEQTTLEGKALFHPETSKKLHVLVSDRLKEIHSTEGFFVIDSGWRFKSLLENRLPNFRLS